MSTRQKNMVKDGDLDEKTKDSELNQSKNAVGKSNIGSTDKSKEGHRKRVRDERLVTGFLNASDRDILECLLFYCYPRRDTYQIADKLITEFKTLENILNKKPQELIVDCGFSENTALLFTLIADISSRIKRKQTLESVFDKPQIVGEFCIDLLKKEVEECLYVVCLNSQMRYIASEKASSGDVTSTLISFRKIAGIALKYNAKGIILTHNHPSGNVTPSASDVSVTKKAIEIMSELQIEVYDHIIVSDIEYYSMLQNKHI